VPYIVYCDTGRRSSAAAFLLNERGFQTFVLKGGTEEQGM
jgi:rhodanese-related sulfurtransferase